MARQKLKVYCWKGINSSGQLLSSKQLAYTETEIRDELAENQIKLIKIKSHLPSTYTQIKNHITEPEIHHFTKQLATMLAASIPITKALRLLRSNSGKASMCSLLSTIIRKIESGTSLSEAMRDAHPHFSGIYSDLIKAGETAGKLPELLERIANYQQKSANLKKNVRKAMAYPSLVLIVATSVLSLMLVVVIPEFEDMFNSVNAELPKATQYLLTLSDWFRDRFTSIFLFIAVNFLITLQCYKRSKKLRYGFSKLVSRLPIIGGIITKSSIARFSRTLATGFSSGVPIVKALDLSVKSVKNLYYQEIMSQILVSATSGNSIHQAMRDTGKFPSLAVQLVMSGEETGTLDTMLVRLADMYESDIDDMVENLGKTLEPILIVILGVVLGTIVLSLYLPIFNLLSVLG